MNVLWQRDEIRSNPLAVPVILCCLVYCLCVPYAGGSTANGPSADYVRAEALVRNHQWDEGLDLLNQLLKQSPNDPRILNLAGLAFTGKGDILRADKYFQRTLDVSPGFVPASKNLAINEFGLRQFAAAEQHLKLAAKAAPDDPVINLYLGEIAYAQHNFQRSAEMLPRARDLLFRDPNIAALLVVSYLQIGQKQKAIDLLEPLAPEHLSPPFQFALGLALAEFDLSGRAVPYLEAAQQNYPASYDIGYDLAVALLSARQYPQAISTARSLIDHGHETAELDNILAEAYEGNKETQLAIDTLRRAIAINPGDENNYLDFASLCMDHHAFDEGMKVVEVGLRVHPRSEQLIFERGILYAMQDHFDLAERDFKESTALAPRSNSGYIGLGVTYIETGNTAQAIPILRERLRKTPNDANLLYLLAEALMRSGAKQGEQAFLEAQTSLEKSVRLNPNLCLPHVSLGSIYLEEGRYQDAVNQLEKARLLDPGEKSAYSHLAIAYRRLGETEKSKETLNSLKEMVDKERAAPRDKVKATYQGPMAISPK